MMSELSTLIELQSIYDYLNIIQRDLSNLPPDLAKLDITIKTNEKKLAGLSAELITTRNNLDRLNKDLVEAKQHEESAKVTLKKSVQKIQYFNNIRKLDECQKQRVSIERPLKEAEIHIVDLEQTHAGLTKQQIELTKEFDELKSIFLAEHTNQIAAKIRLEAKRKVLEETISAPLLAKFNRLIRQRLGQAVVSVDNGVCSGCRTRLRAPLIAKLREIDIVFCESCQRIIYLK